MFTRLFLPYLLVILIVLLGEEIMSNARLAPLLIVASVCVLIISIFFLARIKNLPESPWKHVFLPVFALISTESFMLVAPLKLAINAAIVTLALIIFIFFRIFVKFRKKNEGKFYARLENLSFYSSIISVFYFSASIFGLQSLLNLDLWMLILAGIPFYFVSSLQVFRGAQIPFKTGMPYVFAITLISIELLWALYNLPLNFIVLGLMHSIFYYLTAGLARLCLLGRTNKTSLKLYIGLGFGCFIILLLVSRWI
jgi:hypothetical protein